MANVTTIDAIRQGIATILADFFPGAMNYDSPLQQKAVLPGFFILVLPCSFTAGVGGLYTRKLFWDVSYLINKNQTDAQTQLTAVQETFDLVFQHIPVIDPTDGSTSVRNTFDRKAKLDLMQAILHYTFYTQELVAIDDGTVPTPMPATFTLILEDKDGEQA